MKKLVLCLLLITAGCISCQPQENRLNGLRFASEVEIIPGAWQTDHYFPMLTGKKIGVVCNHTALVNDLHLIDTLVNTGFDLRAIFSPEHGFRGQAQEGKLINDSIDSRTGIRIFSLYGKDKKPTPEQLEGLDLVIYDIQDVGARFYTYLSTMTLVMEACASQGITVVVLDRPNPNGFYVDGPVLDTSFRSFIGMHPVPIVHGMTTGEYALMINGEGWLEGRLHCRLEVIPMKGYDHSLVYKLPVRPSPNLPNWQSVYLYPSLCLFEGTVVSVGRGTARPFQMIGHPAISGGDTTFIPFALTGSTLSPPLTGQKCHGNLLISFADSLISNEIHLNLDLLIGYYRQLSPKLDFFNAYFDRLAGTDKLRLMITNGLSSKEIRESWNAELDHFLEIRKKYLLYPDFR